MRRTAHCAQTFKTHITSKPLYGVTWALQTASFSLYYPCIPREGVAVYATWTA
jgi:hypothetical protein